jgi:hypothetical protein
MAPYRIHMVKHPEARRRVLLRKELKVSKTNSVRGKYLGIFHESLVKDCVPAFKDALRSSRNSSSFRGEDSGVGPLNQTGITT